MSELVATRVREAATRLGLAHLATNLTELLTRADTDKLGYLELLDLVTGEETAVKDSRRYHHALKLAGLPHHKTLDLSGVDLETWSLSQVGTLRTRP